MLFFYLCNIHWINDVTCILCITNHTLEVIGDGCSTILSRIYIMHVLIIIHCIHRKTWSSCNAVIVAVFHHQILYTMYYLILKCVVLNKKSWYEQNFVIVWKSDAVKLAYSTLPFQSNENAKKRGRKLKSKNDKPKKWNHVIKTFAFSRYFVFTFENIKTTAWKLETIFGAFFVVKHRFSYFIRWHCKAWNFEIQLMKLTKILL